MRVLICSILGFISLGPLTYAQSDWVIRDVIPPPQTPVRHLATWNEAQPLGDLSHSGRAGFALLGTQVYFPPFSTTYPSSLTGTISSGLGGKSLDFIFPEWDPIVLEGGSRPRLAILDSPNGTVAVMRDNSAANKLYFYSLTTHQLLGVANQPPALPGEPPVYAWDLIWNAGDLNQDGTDDVFFQNSDASGQHGFLGRIDGSSHSVVWRIFFDSAGGVSQPLAPTPTLGFQDLNGDAIPDFVASFGLYHPLQGANECAIIAFSGIDGATIFDTRISGVAPGSGITSQDFTGDGIADIVTEASDFLIGINGQNGQILWQTDIHDLLPFMPSGSGLVPRNPVFFGEVPNSGMPEYVYAVVKQTETGDQVSTQYVGTFRCSDGQAVGAYRMRGSLEPFAPDSHEGAIWTLCSLLGDIDRDGLTEFAHTVATPSQSKPNIPAIPNSVIIFGQRTLDFPTTLSLSQAQAHVADFHIPSATNMYLQMYLSTSVNRDNGFSHDHWKTSLDEDRFFSWSTAAPMLTLLNSNGEGTITFHLPNHSALVGRSIFARGVVADPSDPLNKVWTMSSLGIGVCTP